MADAGTIKALFEFVERQLEGIRKFSPVLLSVSGILLLLPLDDWLKWELFQNLKGDWLLWLQAAFGLSALSFLGFIWLDIGPIVLTSLSRNSERESLRHKVREASNNQIAEAVLAYLTFITKDAIWFPEEVARQSRVLTREKLLVEIDKRGTQSYLMIDRRVPEIIREEPTLLPNYAADTIDQFLNEAEEWLELAPINDGPYSGGTRFPTLAKMSNRSQQVPEEDEARDLSEFSSREFKERLTSPDDK